MYKRLPTFNKTKVLLGEKQLSLYTIGLYETLLINDSSINGTFYNGDGCMGLSFKNLDYRLT